MEREGGYTELYLQSGSIGPQPVRISHDLSASCPMLCAAQFGALTPLPINQLKVDVEVHVSVAFVQLELQANFPANWQPAQLIFFLPKTHNTTITDIAVHNLSRDEVFATAVVPAAEVQANNWPSTFPTEQPLHQQNPLSQLDPKHPELFTLPLATAHPGDAYKVNLTCVTPLTFQAGRYTLRVPTTLPLTCLPPGADPAQLLALKLAISSGVQGRPVDYELRSHPHRVATSGPGRVELLGDSSQGFKNTDVEVSYQVWGGEIVTSLTLQPPSGAGKDARSTFCLAVAPPAPDRTPAYPRHVVFILDRSGSMGGPPMEAAKDALLTGLKLLTPHDSFNIVAFDHEQLWHSQGLLRATPDNVASASAWLRQHISARGLTDILTPLQQAMGQLAAAGGGGLPCVFLLTDGAVENERQICQYAAAAMAKPPPGMMAPRLTTFGIGRHCNHFFLKQLALQGRGSFDVAFRPEGIRSGMERLLLAAAAPVVTDLALVAPGVQGLELFPYPLPDLFCGQPLMVVGRFQGEWPKGVVLAGVRPGGQAWQQGVASSSCSSRVSLERLMVTQQLDVMTANAWLAEDQKQVQKVVELSVATGVPCAHTHVVGFPTTHAGYQQFQQQAAAGKVPSVGKYVVGGAAAVVVVAGAAALLSFGDVAATAGNVAAFMGGDMLSGVVGAGGGDFCGDCCGGCDLNCGECCGGCDGCGDCCAPLAECFVQGLVGGVECLCGCVGCLFS